jgi:hypothetical protein
MKAITRDFSYKWWDRMVQFRKKICTKRKKCVTGYDILREGVTLKKIYFRN